MLRGDAALYARLEWLRELCEAGVTEPELQGSHG
jgi:hypothetical protein